MYVCLFIAPYVLDNAQCDKQLIILWYEVFSSVSESRLTHPLKKLYIKCTNMSYVAYRTVYSYTYPLVL